MIDFESLLKASQQVDISKAFEDNEKKSFEDDPRYFKLRRKDEIGRSTIRWLPDPQGRIPFVKRYERFVEIDKSAKKWFSANDRQTLGEGEKDPAQELYFAAWKRFNETQDESWKKLAQKFKRQERYISLIYVVNDPNDVPEHSTSGMNYLYKYGPELYGKLAAARKTQDDFGMPLKPINPFALNGDGANFGILLKKEDPKNPNEFPNYANSKFFEHAPLFDGDRSAIQNWMNVNKDRFFDIYDEVSESKFESYDAIVKKLINALGENLYYDLMGGRKVVESDKRIEDSSPNVAPTITSPVVTTASLTSSLDSTPSVETNTAEEDPLLALFK